MKTKLVLLGILVVLAGCEVSDMDKARAEYTCSERGGAYGVSVFLSYAQCNDGSTHKLKSVVSKEYWLKKESNDE